MIPTPARAHILIPLAGLVALAALCTWWVLFRGVLALGNPIDRKVKVKVENPHWNENQCGQCHAPADGEPRAIPMAKVDALCLRCHDGKSAASEIHPIARPLDGRKMDVPKSWPLNDGRLGCATCHDVREACSKTANRPDENTSMLGASTPGKAFCVSCHREEQFTKFNPHLMLSADRKPVEEKCRSCHSEIPDHNIDKPVGKPSLVADQFTLCKSCHAHHEDQFNPGHIGARVKPEMLALMRARESLGLAATPGNELLAKLKADGVKPTLLRPNEQSLIQCTTCHNPHQAGLFKSGTPAAYGAMRMLNGKPISPVRGEQWCNHCHSDF